MNAVISTRICDAEVDALQSKPGLLDKEKATVDLHLVDGSEVKIELRVLLRAMAALQVDNLLPDHVTFSIEKQEESEPSCFVITDSNGTKCGKPSPRFRVDWEQNEIPTCEKHAVGYRALGMTVKEREIEADAKPEHLLHRLWTKAVGTPDYVKNEWRRLEALLARQDNR